MWLLPAVGPQTRETLAFLSGLVSSCLFPFAARAISPSHTGNGSPWPYQTRPWGWGQPYPAPTQPGRDERPYLIRQHAACRRACRKHMSLVKQIVKASITSLWQSLAEFIPTASISCTLSCEWDQPSPLRCSLALALPSLPGDGAAPWGAMKHHPERQTISCQHLVTFPRMLLSAYKPAPQEVRDGESLLQMPSPSSGSLQQITPRASCTNPTVRDPVLAGSTSPEPSNSLAGSQPLGQPCRSLTCLIGTGCAWRKGSPSSAVPEELSQGATQGSAASPGAICSRRTLIKHFLLLR